MARVLTDYDFKKTKTKAHKSTTAYPWEQWFDGRIWAITWGEDFPESVHPLMMERIVRTRASDRKVRVQIKHEDDKTIVLRATVGGGRVPQRPRVRRIPRPQGMPLSA